MGAGSLSSMVEMSSGGRFHEKHGGDEQGRIWSMVDLSNGAGSMRSMVEMSRGSMFHYEHGGFE